MGFHIKTNFKRFAISSMVNAWTYEFIDRLKDVNLQSQVESKNYSSNVETH